MNQFCGAGASPESKNLRKPSRYRYWYQFCRARGSPESKNLRILGFSLEEPSAAGVQKSEILGRIQFSGAGTPPQTFRIRVTHDAAES